MGLRWSDIDLEAATLTVRRRWYRGDVSDPKSEKSKRVKRLGPLVEVFKQKYIKVFAGVGVDGDTLKCKPDEGFCSRQVGKRWVEFPDTLPDLATAGSNPARQHQTRIKDQYVFLGEDGLTPPDPRDILRYELRPILKRLGLYFAGFGFHQFRRCQITLSQTVGGATSLEAAKGAGHSHVDMTLSYSLVDSDRQQEQVTRLYDWLMGGSGGTKQ